MNCNELKRLLEILEEIPNEEKRAEAVRLTLSMAAKNLTKDSEAPFEEGNSKGEKEQGKTGILLKFTQKEISKIPMRFRKEIMINDKLVHCRRQPCGKNTTRYEFRYRRHGYNITASSTNLEEAKRKFIRALQEAEGSVEPQRDDVLEKFYEFAEYLMNVKRNAQGGGIATRGKGVEARKKTTKTLPVDEESEEQPGVPTKFSEFAEYYFENYRKRKVTKQTLENDTYRYKKHLKPYFGSKQLKDITPMSCQKFLDGFAEKGQMKTNNELYSLLNGIFKLAMAYGIVTKNPLAVVIVKKHKSKHGTALTKEEEGKLLESLEGSRYQTLMAVALYTGLRPNEFKTAKIENEFIVAINSKRKGGKVEYKKIPITEMLKPYLNGVTQLEFPCLEYMRDTFNKILPNHILYDLRTTFYTRCEECGVAPPARDEFVGHSRGELNSTYSDLSDEYLLNEGKKLVW